LSPKKKKKKKKQEQQVDVLVVEDDLTLLETLEYNLIAEGYQVHTAADGLTALEVAREEQSDLIVLDLMLPGSISYLSYRVGHLVASSFSSWSRCSARFASS